MEKEIQFLKEAINKAVKAGVYDLNEVHTILMVFAKLDAVQNIEPDKKG